MREEAPRLHSRRSPSRARRKGVLIGGSGLVGGTILHHFKKGDFEDIEILAPNSKEVSIRVRSDIEAYFDRMRPDFIVNCAIASLGSDPELTFEVNCRGAVWLARVSHDLGIPYIHFSSGAVLPSGADLSEEARLPVSPGMPNYAKGKLLAELALDHMAETLGLDFTSIRLGIVYGGHDHKIQGFHHLLFALVEGSMPALLTTRKARHSYSNASKLPWLLAHVLDHREEFGGETYHFVDPEPVRLGELILDIKRRLGARTPREIYVPYWIARLCIPLLSRIARTVSRIGIDARPPDETVFLRSFYESQVLSAEKLRRSSFLDPDPDATLFTELAGLIDYYVPRWEHLNLVETRAGKEPAALDTAEKFAERPEELLSSLLAEEDRPFLERGSGRTREARPTAAEAPADDPVAS